MRTSPRLGAIAVRPDPVGTRCRLRRPRARGLRDAAWSPGRRTGDRRPVRSGPWSVMAGIDSLHTDSAHRPRRWRRQRMCPSGDQRRTSGRLKIPSRLAFLTIASGEGFSVVARGRGTERVRSMRRSEPQLSTRAVLSPHLGRGAGTRNGRSILCRSSAGPFDPSRGRVVRAGAVPDGLPHAQQIAKGVREVLDRRLGIVASGHLDHRGGDEIGRRDALGARVGVPRTGVRRYLIMRSHGARSACHAVSHDVRLENSPAARGRTRRPSLAPSTMTAPDAVFHWQASAAPRFGSRNWSRPDRRGP